MGVYISGMKMPTSCADCWFEYAYEFCEGKYEDCPLIEIPPQGRLIDADAFADEMKKRQEEAEKWRREAKDHETAVRADAVLSFLCEVKLTLDASPTISPAEEDE